MIKKPFNAIKYLFNFSETKKKIREQINQYKKEKGKDKLRTAVSLHLMATAEKIIELFIYKRDLSKPINTPFNTWISALATLRTCCSRTMQRHLDALLEAGIIKNKFRRNHGIAFEINTDFLAYEILPTAGSRPKSNPMPAQPEIVQHTQEKPANLAEMASCMVAKFSMKNALSG